MAHRDQAESVRHSLLNPQPDYPEPDWDRFDSWYYSYRRIHGREPSLDEQRLAEEAGWPGERDQLRAAGLIGRGRDDALPHTLCSPQPQTLTDGGDLDPGSENQHG